MSNPGFLAYLLFVVSWFGHLPARVPFLGSLRLDLVLVVLLAALAFFQSRSKTTTPTPAAKTDLALRVLVVYAVLSVPFVEWPGSVIRSGLPEFIKAVVFYYFTVAFVRTEVELKRFMLVFLSCQAFRIIEPLYLHVTEGYWGSRASMAGGFLDRLAGGPYDILNPNGLAFVICTILPFLYFLSALSWKHRLMSLLLVPPAVYALSLTGSRSGLVGFAIVCVGVLFKSNHRALLIVVFVAASAVGFSMLDSDMQDRYLSAVGLGEKNEATADERVDGTLAQVQVALRRPLFGHGLGTSPEANFNFTTEGPYVGKALPAHNLYLEIFEELGIFGVIIFTIFIKATYTSFKENKRIERQHGTDIFLPRLLDAMQVWLAMSFIFSFASYGLSNYDWYLFAGLSVVTRRLAKQHAAEANIATGAAEATVAKTAGMGQSAHGNKEAGVT